MKKSEKRLEIADELLQLADVNTISFVKMGLIEEMAELTQALVKLQRIEEDKNPHQMIVTEIFDNVLEEIADVEIMLAQFKAQSLVTEVELYDIKREKIKRTKERLGLIDKN